MQREPHAILQSQRFTMTVISCIREEVTGSTQGPFSRELSAPLLRRSWRMMLLTISYTTHPVAYIRACPGDPKAFHFTIIICYTSYCDSKLYSGHTHFYTAVFLLWNHLQNTLHSFAFLRKSLVLIHIRNNTNPPDTQTHNPPICFAHRQHSKRHKRLPKTAEKSILGF